MEDETKLSTEPVPYKKLKEHIGKLEERLEYPYWDGFDKEWRPLSRAYEQPPKMPLHYYETAIKPENRDKNRYGNALPPEETRVKLKKKDGDENSDYINASWVKGFDDKETNYIITQGPMTETFTDFWRMVWESGSNVIVMLTRELENGRPKCDRYWEPDKGKEFRLGPLSVTLESEDVKDNGELFVRTFTLKYENDARTITQYQYTAWPDQGIPPSFHSFLEIVEGADQKKQDKPIIVHCSAGLGRSGAFAMVHSSYKYLQAELAKGNEDPKFHMEDLLLKMRKQRHGLIQTGKQFEFVYRAINELTDKVFEEHEKKKKTE
jgi:protein tyrosine phosphatase